MAVKRVFAGYYTIRRQADLRCPRGKRYRYRRSCCDLQGCQLHPGAEAVHRHIQPRGISGHVRGSRVCPAVAQNGAQRLRRSLPETLFRGAVHPQSSRCHAQNRGVIERRQAALYRAFAQLLQQRDEADGVCRLMQKIEYNQRDIEDLLE